MIDLIDRLFELLLWVHDLACCVFHAVIHAWDVLLSSIWFVLKIAVFILLSLIIEAATLFLIWAALFDVSEIAPGVAREIAQIQWVQQLPLAAAFLVFLVGESLVIASCFYLMRSLLSFELLSTTLDKDEDSEDRYHPIADTEDRVDPLTF